MNEWASRITKEKDALNFNFNFKETETVLPSAEGVGFVFFTSFEALTTRLSNLDFGKKDTHLSWFVLNLLHFEKINK